MPFLHPTGPLQTRLHKGQEGQKGQQQSCPSFFEFLEVPRGERKGNGRASIPKGMPEALSCDIKLRRAKKRQIKHPLCKGPAASVRGMPEAQSRQGMPAAKSLFGILKVHSCGTLEYSQSEFVEHSQDMVKHFSLKMFIIQPGCIS